MSLKNMYIGIVGNGVVGKATARSYLEHVAEVRCWDSNELRSTHELGLVLSCDVVFLCLPTPKGEGGAADLSAIHQFLRGLGTRDRQLRNFVLRSTVPIGTTKALATQYGMACLTHSPEFLTARCSTLDAQIPSRSIIGCPYDPPGYMCGCCTKIRYLYESRFPGVPLLTMSSDESEAVKLIQNSFFAVKVAFWNEMRLLTDLIGLDWDTIRLAIMADGRIHPSHTMVPGPDGKRGFGGACLPKDLAALVAQMNMMGVTPQVCSAAVKYGRDQG